MLNFLRFKTIYFIVSGILILGSLYVILAWGLVAGIEFTGGTLINITYKNERPAISTIKGALADFGLLGLEVKTIEDKGINLRISEKNISSDLEQQITEKLKTTGEIEEDSLSFETISSVIGKELKGKTQIVTILSVLVIMLYIGLAFIKVARPIPSWQYGLSSLLTLLQDILITLGVFAVLGKFYGVQITIPVVTALLVIVGYAINDKIVVFDRIRENLLKRSASSYEEIVNISLNQTLVRCLSTSATTLLVLFSLFFFGGESLKYFALALITGITVGTYSSLFLAAPLLVGWLKLKERKLNRP